MALIADTPHYTDFFDWDRGRLCMQAKGLDRRQYRERIWPNADEAKKAYEANGAMIKWSKPEGKDA